MLEVWRGELAEGAAWDSLDEGWIGGWRHRLALPEAVKDWPLRSVHVNLVKIGGRRVRHARRLVLQLAAWAVFKEVFRANVSLRRV